MSLLDRVLCDTAEELGCKPDNEAILLAIRAQADRIAELEAALAFYADRDNHMPKWDNQFKTWVTQMDDGQRAREALAIS